MTIDISHLAYAARKASERDGFPPLKHGHALELTVAALGYGSLAAYKAAVAVGKDAADFSAARHIVLQLQSIVARAGELRPMAPSLTHLEWIRRAFAQCLPHARLHIDENSLFNALVQLIDTTTVNDGGVSGEMAVGNCDGVGEIYLPLHFSLVDVPIGVPHVLDIQGHIAMDIHEERFPMGRKVSIQALLELQKLGKFVIAEPIFKIENAKLVYDWADDED
jgi:hypothetical protein